MINLLILPKWLAVYALSLTIFVLILLGHIRNQQRELKKMKADKEEDALLIKQC